MLIYLNTNSEPTDFIFIYPPYCRLVFKSKCICETLGSDKDADAESWRPLYTFHRVITINNECRLGATDGA